MLWIKAWGLRESFKDKSGKRNVCNNLISAVSKPDEPF
jgi:hypothetical protein